MNKLWVKQRLQALWKSLVCGCLMLPSSVGAVQATASSELDCAATPFQAPGQPWQIGFSLVATSAPTKLIAPDLSKLFPAVVSANAERSAETQPNNVTTPFTPGHVDLLVVDDFRPIPMRVASSDPQPKVLKLSHGNLVVAHLRALLESADYTSSSPYWLSYRKTDPDDPTRVRVITIVRHQVDSVNPGSPSASAKPANPSIPTDLSSILPAGSVSYFGSARDFKSIPKVFTGVPGTVSTSPVSPGGPGTTVGPKPVPPTITPGSPLDGTARFPYPIPDPKPPRFNFPPIIVPLSSLQQSLNIFFQRTVDPTPPANPGFRPTVSALDIEWLPEGTKASDTTAPEVVVNMSLSVFNCDMLKKFETYRDASAVGVTLFDFIDAESQKIRSTSAKIMADLTNIPDDSEFMKKLKDQFDIVRPASFEGKDTEAHTVAVAASGNYGLTHSTAPGSLLNVISVGARTSDWKQPLSSTKPYNWSNRADVLTVGEGFTLTQKQLTDYCDMGETCIAEDIKPNRALPDGYQGFYYSGTSFAAPSVSAFLATRIGDDPCFEGAGSLGFKPLQTKDQKYEFRGNWIYQSCAPGQPLIPPRKPAP